MKAYIVSTAMGPLAFGEDLNLFDMQLYDKDAGKAASLLSSEEEGKVTEHLRILASRVVERGFSAIVVESEELGRSLRKEVGIGVEVEQPSKAGVAVRSNVSELAVRAGFVGDDSEWTGFLRSVGIARAKAKLKEVAEKRDISVAHAINAVDEIDKTINLFVSRIREWYSVHFPELDNLEKDHERYLRLVEKVGLRDGFSVEDLVELGFPQETAQKITDSSRNSIGAQFGETDIAPVRSLASHALTLQSTRKTLESYVESTMTDVAPNLTGLIGAMLAARLVALAGGLRPLSRMPASTIQVLGAEKALFRSLKTGSRPPKHGIIFQHPDIHVAPRWQRGKMARAVAGKLAIASRVDVFSGAYAADRLKVALDERVENIKKTYAKPPERKREAAPAPQEGRWRRPRQRGRKRR